MQVDVWVALIAAAVGAGVSRYSSGGRGGHTRRRLEQEIEIRDSLRDAELASVLDKQIEMRLVAYLDASLADRYHDSPRQLLRLVAVALAFGVIVLAVFAVALNLPDGELWQTFGLMLQALGLGLIGSIIWVGTTMIGRSFLYSQLSDRAQYIDGARARLRLYSEKQVSDEPE